MKTKKVKAFITSLFLFALTYVAYLFNPGTFIYDFRRSSDFFDILEWMSLYLVVTMFVLVFFSDKIFVSWFKHFFVWFLPLSIIFIIIGSGDGFLQPSYDDLAILSGEIMVGVTLIFVLVQRYYYKLK